MRNAVKAQIIVVANSALALLLAFGVEVSDGQQLAIAGFVNACLSFWVLLTDKGASPQA